MLYNLHHNLQFRLPIHPSLLLILPKSEAVVPWCSYKFHKVNKKIPALESCFHWSCRSAVPNFIKKETLAQIFSCEFCEISHNIFFKEFFRWLLLHSHSFWLCHHGLWPFQKRFSIIFIVKGTENLSISSPSYENNYVEDFTLRHLLLFELCAREISEQFVYKLSETKEYFKN